jgi:cation diffusion facilitator family transporter
MTQAERLAPLTIPIGCLVLALKTAAWWLTGSVALYSDALESIVNVAASLVALLALRIAARPADANHPYGHAKAEFFAAIIEGVLIIVAAVSILERAWSAWHNPIVLDAPWTGIALNALATGLNGTWALVLLRAGRRLKSPTLAADGTHLMTDVVTSVGVAIGVALAVTTGQMLLDPIAAVLTALYVLWSGMIIISRSADGLMDGAPDAAIVGRIRAVVAEAATGALEAHDLRTRHAGSTTFLDFHLVVPGSMTVSESHQNCDRIEDALRAEMGDLIVTIHVEPEEKVKRHGVPVL